MVNTCSIATCQANYNKRKDKKDFIPEKLPAFGFPSAEDKPDLRKKWIHFVNRQNWQLNISIHLFFELVRRELL